MNQTTDTNTNAPPAVSSSSSDHPPPDIPRGGGQQDAGGDDVAETATPNGNDDGSMDVDTVEAGQPQASTSAPSTPSSIWTNFRAVADRIITPQNAGVIVKIPEPAASVSPEDDGGISSMRFKQTAKALATKFYQQKAAPARPKGQVAWQDTISFGLQPYDVFDSNKAAQAKAFKILKQGFNKCKKDLDLDSYRLVLYGDRLTLHKCVFDHSPKEGYRHDVNNGWDYLDPCNVSSANEALLGHVLYVLDKLAQLNELPYSVVRRCPDPIENIRTALFYFYLPDYMELGVDDDLEKHHLEAILNQFQTQISQFAPGSKVLRKVRLNELKDIAGATKPSYQVLVSLLDNLGPEMNDFNLVLDPTKDHYSGLQTIKVHFADAHGVCVKCKSTKHERLACPHAIYKKADTKMKIPQVFVPIANIGKIPEKPQLETPTKSSNPAPQVEVAQPPSTPRRNTGETFMTPSAAIPTPWTKAPTPPPRSRRHSADSPSTPTRTKSTVPSNKFQLLASLGDEDITTTSPTPVTHVTHTVPPGVQSMHAPPLLPSADNSDGPIKSMALTRGSPSRNPGSGRRANATEETLAPGPTFSDTPRGKRGRPASSPSTPRSQRERSKAGASPSKKRAGDQSPEKSSDKITGKQLGMPLRRLWRKDDTSRVIVSASREGTREVRYFDLPAIETRKVCDGHVPTELEDIHFTVFFKEDKTDTASIVAPPDYKQADKVCDTLEEIANYLSETPFELTDVALQTRSAESQ